MPPTEFSMEASLRVYVPGDDEFGKDGYPKAWHDIVKHAVREQAEHRCERCGHPYRRGEHGRGEWTPCDARCTHEGPRRVRYYPGGDWLVYEDETELSAWLTDPARFASADLEARWRILTVHHLTGDKADCRWWNLAALCQRCHLTIQGRVVMERVWPWEHSEWFKPHAAGWYAHSYLGEDITRGEAAERVHELLALEAA